jgi:hypothetical protein
VEYPGDEILVLWRTTLERRNLTGGSRACPALRWKDGPGIISLSQRPWVSSTYLGRTRSAGCKSKVNTRHGTFLRVQGLFATSCWPRRCLVLGTQLPPITETLLPPGPLRQIGHLTQHPEYWYVRPSLCRNSQVPRGGRDTCGGPGWMG